MSEKRFTIHKESKYKEEWYAYPFCIKEDGEVVFNTVPLSIAEKVRDKLNEQQATIRKLQDLCGESDGENAKLRIENKKLKAKLKEKEEDERLYANEILELRKTNEEWLQFKDLGGDY